VFVEFQAVSLEMKFSLVTILKFRNYNLIVQFLQLLYGNIQRLLQLWLWVLCPLRIGHCNIGQDGTLSSPLRPL